MLVRTVGERRPAPDKRRELTGLCTYAVGKRRIVFRGKGQRRSAVARVALLSLLAALVPATTAYAAAGGGSSGFGGGHGGGGRGFIIYLILRFVIELVILHPIVLAFFAVAIAGYYGNRTWQRTRADRTRRKRERRVELAAAEASEDDPDFDPEAVRSRATTLFREIQSAWDARDRARLQTLVGAELWTEWERRLDDFERRGWHNRVSVKDGPRVRYVGLSNRGGENDRRVVVHVNASMRDYVEDSWGQGVTPVNQITTSRRLDEYWTLAKRDGRWVVVSIEQEKEGSHQLDGELVATPSADLGRLRDESLVELAEQDRLPSNANTGELLDLDFADDARAAALDLSLVDGRFAPDVIEVAVRRAVAAWAEAVDGDRKTLRSIATPDAERELLHPGDPSAQTRLVVRGPRVRCVTITRLDAASDPPRLSVAVEAEGRRYIEARDTAAVLSGSRERSVRFTEHWTLSLDGTGGQPWLLTAAGAELIPRSGATG